MYSMLFLFVLCSFLVCLRCAVLRGKAGRKFGKGVFDDCADLSADAAIVALRAFAEGNVRICGKSANTDEYSFCGLTGHGGMPLICPRFYPRLNLM